MKAVVTTDEFRHAPGVSIARGVEMPLLEQPVRAAELRQSVQDAGLELIAPRNFGLDPILCVHSRPYVDFLATAYERWQAMRVRGFEATTVVQSSGFTLRDRHERVPATISAQVDYYLAGGWAPIDIETYQAAVASAHVAVEAAQLLMEGEHDVYALCRPPGHHAYADLAGGYCYLNNVAIAAEHLAQALGQVAILDIDVHHGNGTQSIFYDRADVHFVSLHADPDIAYPYYCGFADETGRDSGLGHTLNLPLARGTGDADYLVELERGLTSIAAFKPEALLVSVGLDGYEDDPTQLLKLTTDGFRRIGERIGALGLPTALVQEGGYNVEALGANLRALLDGVQSCRTVSA